MSLIHPTAVISSDASVGQNVTVGAFAVVGTAQIGDDCVIHPHAILSDGVQLGRGVEVLPGAFIGKAPSNIGVSSREVQGGGAVRIGDHCSIGPNVVVYANVEIGERTLIGDGASIREQCRIGHKCLISRCVTINYNTVIGDGTKVMDLTHLTGNMVIEDNVFISTMVATTNDNIIREGYGSHVVGPTIRRDAIIGAGAILLPAVTVGQGATVAAGSVVTRDVESGVTVMGIPARPAPAPS